MVYNEDDHKELNHELIAFVEDCFPNGVEFFSVIDYFSFANPNLFSLYQLLLLAELLINCDEFGRKSLKKISD